MAEIPDPLTTNWVPIWNPLTEGPAGPAGPAGSQGPQGIPGNSNPHHLTHETGGTDEILFPSGIVERGRTFAMGVWQSYVPVWGAFTSPPTLGNATLTGSYILIGKTCWYKITFSYGSTSSPGTGFWTFTLPPVAPVQVNHASLALYGTAAANYMAISSIFSFVAPARIYVNGNISGGALTPIGGTSPAPAATGDTIILSGMFEIV